MKPFSIFITIIFFTFTNAVFSSSDYPQITFEINVINYQDDLFHITVYTQGLDKENNIYNLPATVPGTYSVLDFGRFVKSFSAYDDNGNQLMVERLSTNRWKIMNVDKLSKIKYDVEDTFDADVDSHKVIPMEGTGINNNFILLNTFAVVGYFEGLQSMPVKMKLDYNPDWVVGTSLQIDDSGYYTAESYDFFADSPILLGELTTAQTTVNNINVGVYVYSPDSTRNAGMVLQEADSVLQAIGKYIGYSPVKNYNYLICFLDEKTFNEAKFPGAGALEHSYSSLFFYPGFGELGAGLKDDLAHEFLHILTPLNLHSNIIDPFNFEIPTASEHLWLYEGVTEWGSDISQLRGGLITTDQYLKKLSDKITTSNRFRKDISLTYLSKNVYSDAITMEFINFYNKGAVTAAMLDIRLLELSNGTRGLRDVFLDLLDQYGKNRPFPENEFFEIFVKSSYPEIQEFIDDYIIGSKLLPVNEYMTKLGFDFIEESPSDDIHPTLGVQMGLNDKNQIVIVGLDDNTNGSELLIGDIPLKILGVEVNLGTVKQILGKIKLMKSGDVVSMIVQRDENNVEVNVTLKQKMDRNIFKEMKLLTEQQKQLKEAWLKNL